MSAPLYYGRWYEPQAVWSKLLDEDMEEIRDMVAEAVHKELAPLRREINVDELGAQFFDILSDTLKKTSGSPGRQQKEEEQDERKKASPVLQEDGVCALCPTCGKLDHYCWPDLAYPPELKGIVYALHKHLDWCLCGKKKQ